MFSAATGEGKGVGALTSGFGRNLGETKHVGLNNGEPDEVSIKFKTNRLLRVNSLKSRGKLHVDCKFAVLAPVDRVRVWASLDFVGRKCDLKKTTRGIHLDICRTRGTASSKNAHTLDGDILRLRGVGLGNVLRQGQGGDAGQGSEPEGSQWIIDHGN